MKHNFLCEDKFSGDVVEMVFNSDVIVGIASISHLLRQLIISKTLVNKAQEPTEDLKEGCLSMLA